MELGLTPVGLVDGGISIHQLPDLSDGPHFPMGKSTGKAIMKAIQKSVSISMDPPPPLSWAEEAIIDRELELAAGAAGCSSGEEEQSREHTVLAVACCALITDGITTRFQCKFPDCGRDYASRDAVRKHCRIRHLQWCARLTASQLLLEYE